MRALVTGAGRGIGAGIARALAGDGSEVVVGVRSQGQVEAAVCRYGEMLANELAGRTPVFFFSPGLGRGDARFEGQPSGRQEGPEVRGP